MCDSKAHGGVRCDQHGRASKQIASLRAAARYQKRIGNEEKAAQLTADADHLKEAHNHLGENIIQHKLELSPTTEKVLNTLKAAGLNGYIVGGSVRDSLLGIQSKDIDIEVYGGEVNKVISTLKKLGKVDQVGKSFGVLKININGEDFDVSLPRRDSKTGEGHRGFTIEVDSNLSFEEATARRDFAFNSMMYDKDAGVIIDPHNGYDDLNNGIIRHTSDAFGEDPLRVVRGVQFASRFNMRMHPDTVKESQKLFAESPNLPDERVAGEMEKLYLKSDSPVAGFKVLKETGWDAAFPGLKEINNEELHTELDRVSKLVGKDKRVAAYSAVIIKRLTNKEDREAFLRKSVIGDGPKSVARHLVSPPPVDLKAYTVREWADSTLSHSSARDWFNVNSEHPQVIRAAARYGVEHTYEEPILQGRDLLAHDSKAKPGPWMGRFLKDARVAQYSGEFRTKEDAALWMRNNIGKYQQT